MSASTLRCPPKAEEKLSRLTFTNWLDYNLAVGTVEFIRGHDSTELRVL